MASERNSVVLPVMAVVFVCFVVAGVLSNRDREPTGRPAAVADDVRPISARVEAIRGLRFREIPEPRVVSPETARADALRDLDEHYPREERQADAELLALLGLVPPDTDLREITGEVSGEQVAGYYDTRRESLAVVDGAAAADDVLAEITLAHELVHALEDQIYELQEDPGQGADDSATAYAALVEGTATSVMNEYAQRFISPGAALSSAFGSLGEATAATEAIPPYIQRSLEFSYVAGEAFVRRLRAAAGDDEWKLVDFALERRPPASTEQIMHPEKYLAFEAPQRVRIADQGLGSEWERAAAGSLGEFDTRELLRLGGPDVPADAAAAGWGGGRYELWLNEAAAEECASPCRSAAIVVLRWVWDTREDAREFAAALPRYVSEGLDGDSDGRRGWRLESGAAAIHARGNARTLVLAPSVEAAARIAGSAGR